MRRVAPLLLLAANALAPAQKPFSLPVPPATRTLKEMMQDGLSDPAAQIAVGVTETQRNLQILRLNSKATKTTFGTLRAYVKDEDGEYIKQLQTQWELTPGRALFPFLAPAQVERLRRFVIRKDPLTALGTNEVAFALSLTEAQKSKIEALRLKGARWAIDPSRPSIQALQKGVLRAMSLAPKEVVDETDTEAALKRLETANRIFDALYASWEQSTRLRAKERNAKAPDPLTFLTPTQRRLLRELS